MSAPCIYDDLNNTDLGDRVIQLQERNETLHKHIQTLENDIAKLCTELTQMKATKDNLQTNISELFNTAKLEIQRKDRMIAELRSNLDDLLFRRANRLPYETETSKNSSKRTRDDIPLESEDSKRPKHESNPSDLNEVTRSTGKTEPRLPFQRDHSRQTYHKPSMGGAFSNRSDSKVWQKEDNDNRIRNRQAEIERSKYTSREYDRTRNTSRERGRSQSSEQDRFSYRSRNNSSHSRCNSKDRLQSRSKSKEKNVFKSSNSVINASDIKKKRYNGLESKSNAKLSDKSNSVKFSNDSRKEIEIKNHTKLKKDQEGRYIKSELCKPDSSRKHSESTRCHSKNNVKVPANSKHIVHLSNRTKVKSEVEIIEIIDLEANDEPTNKRIKQERNGNVMDSDKQNDRKIKNNIVQKALKNRGDNLESTKNGNSISTEMKEGVNTGINTVKVEDIETITTDTNKEVNTNIHIVKDGDVQINATCLDSNKADNSVNQNNINGQVVENTSEMTLNAQINLESEEVVVKEESGGIQVCNISSRQSGSARKRRRCVLKIVN